MYDRPVRPIARSLVLAAALVAGVGAQVSPPFPVVEASIADVHAAMRDGRLTCRALVESYLARIAAYDKNGPALNAIVQVNPQALDEAERLDARFRTGGFVGPLHCVPTIVKDNFETVGLQSANGSLALEGFVSPAMRFRCGASRTRAGSFWPSRTWPSGRSRRTRR